MTAQLTTFVSFNGVNGESPSGLIAGANGDLLGTTAYGGTDNNGTVDLWTNNGYWNLTSPTDWSLGPPPTSTTPAVIQSGTCTISNPGSGEAERLTIDAGAEVSLDEATALSVTDWLNNVGTWILASGDTATTGGLLANSGTLDIGAISASTTVTAASLDNTGGRPSLSPRRKTRQ